MIPNIDLHRVDTKQDVILKTSGEKEGELSLAVVTDDERNKTIMKFENLNSKQKTAAQNFICLSFENKRILN